MRTRVLTAVLAAFGLSMFGVASTASATAEEPDCRTISTELIDRPDSAVGGGTWALDTMTRTAVVCEIEPGDYSGEVADVGTFITQDLDHTPAGAAQPLPAGIEGTINGGFATIEFEAAEDWATFDPSVLDGVTVTGADHPSGTWVSELFTDVDQSTLDGDNWSWTYTTCSEEWVNQASALGGNSGDITSVPDCPDPPEVCEWDAELLANDDECVEPDETGQEQDTDTEQETDDSTPAPVPTAVPAGSQLPDTGVNPVLIGLAGAGLVGLGVGGLWMRRRFDH